MPLAGIYPLSLLFFCMVTAGCSGQKDPMVLPIDTPVRFEYDLLNLLIDSNYIGPQNRGIIANAQMIKEASGLATCRSNTNMLWTHNDAGNANHLHVVGTYGENLGFFWVRGANNRDWEDMCVGPGPKEGEEYVYIGDIGDNQAQYPSIFVHRFPEPNLEGRSESVVMDIDPATIATFEFVYPDGPRDAETLMIDPWSKDLYIVTKREARSSIYRAKYPYQENGLNTLVKVGEFPFNRALAGDISADGKMIVIKTDRRLYKWERHDGESIIEALKRTPRLLPYFVEPQGESFAWSVDGNTYFTLSEQSGNILPALYMYEKK